LAQQAIKKRYSVIFIDGMSIKVRRDYVDNESVYIIVGINEEGYREIIDFYIAPTESFTIWKECLLDLKKRGVKEVLLGVMDGLPGLPDAFHKVFPNADVQRCVVHKLRNTANKIRKKHSDELLEDLKPVYKSPNLKYAKESLNAFKNKWNDLYPNVVKSWFEDQYELLAFYKYPEAIRKSIYTTN
jgi:transposase-like protein